MTDPLEPLRPLTPQQQDEFDHRRESASVLQTKCSQCGAWYETYKRSLPFQEAFDCDCGQPITFEVPALDARSLGLNLNDTDLRLDTGMEIREAVATACHWWGKTGRHLMKRQDKRTIDQMVSADPDSANYMPSAILNGEPWDHLDKREKVQVVKAWHHHFIRKPQTL